MIANMDNDDNLGPCWEVELARRGGYGRVWIGKRQLAAHRIAWIGAHGPIPEGVFVLHKCDNPGCIRVSHLYLGGHAENSRDRVLRGRSWRKLADEEVAAIRAAYGRYGRGGVSGKDLAAQYGIGRSQVSRIVNGQRRTG